MTSPYATQCDVTKAVAYAITHSQRRVTVRFGAKTPAEARMLVTPNRQSSAESAIARNTWEQAPMRKRFLLLRGGIFEAGRRVMTDSESQPSTGGVPPGLPGAGWVLAAFLVFAAVVF